MSPKDLLDLIEKAWKVINDLFGPQVGYVLTIIIVVAALLFTLRPAVPDAARFIDLALLLCFLFGIIIVAYGIFTHENVAGLALQKGFFVGTIAGTVAALTAGFAYYGFDSAACCNDAPSIKLFRLLAASVPMGAVLGGLMGLFRPTGQVRKKADQEAVPAVFIPVLLSFFVLLVLCLAFFFIFNNNEKLFHDSPHPQGLLRYWQVSLLVGCFTVIYVSLIIYLYGRADEKADRASRLLTSISSTAAAVLSAIVLFAVPVWTLGMADFETRDVPTICATPLGPPPACADCMKPAKPGEAKPEWNCRGDPTHANPLAAILLRTLVLILVVLVTYLCATHPRSPLLKLMDPWLIRPRSSSSPRRR